MVMPKPSRPAIKPLTRDNLKSELGAFRDGIKTELGSVRAGIRAEMKETTREIISHFSASQGKQNDWIKEEFSTINTKLDAIMSGELLVTRKQFQRLLRTLAARGIEVNEAEILAA